MRSVTCALVLIVLACAPSSRPALPTAQCTYASECSTSQICSSSGRCVPQCAADRDCATGQKCTAGACVLPSGHCLRDSDCGSGQVCGATGLCGATCASSSQCGSGFVCLANTCVAQQPECVKDADCGLGRVCTSSNTCAQSCTAPTQCQAAQTCSAGTCVAAQPQCATSADCAAPQVCRLTRCVAQCAADQDCGANQRCQSGVCQQLPAQCARNSDCPANKSCVSGACADACVASRDCPAGNVCNLGLCVLPAPQCAVATDCASGQACSPAGQCVASCSATVACTTGACSNGACVPNGPDTATVGGSATYAGQASSAGIVVKLAGPGFAQAVTDATGSYSFAGLPPGLYSVTITAAFSAEGTITTQVSAKAGVTSTIPAVSFSPRGEVKGTVVLQGQTSALGVNVFVSGTSRGTTADASGSFDLTGVPVGSQQIIASYPGYNAASATVTVAAGVLTTVPGTLTLTPQVVSNSGIFAFQSTPPLTVVQNHAYVYTAVAAGAGVSGVTYSIAAGPPGMTINVTSGAVSFTPAFIAGWTVAIAATGGGALIYQVFNLTVTSQVQQQLASPNPVRDGDTAGGTNWLVESNAVARFAGTAASSAVNFDASTPQRSAKTTSVTLANGGNITGSTYPGGKITSVAASAGTLAATWPGGTVPAAGPTIPSSITIASARLEGGTVKSVSVTGSATATGITYKTGTASSIVASRLVPTSVGAADPTTTGIATGVTATVLTDTAQSWTTAAAGQCITNAALGSWFVIAATPAPTATALTITTPSPGAPDLTTILGAGERYFVVPCYSGYLSYRMSFVGSGVTFVASQSIDAYLSGSYFSTYTTATGTTESFTLSAPITQYAALVQLPASGFVLAAQPGNYHLLTINDSTVTGVTTGKIGAPGISGTFVVDASSAAGKIVVQVPAGRDIVSLFPGSQYVLADGNGMVSATVNASGLSASPGQYIWNDNVGAGYLVSAASASSPVTILVAPQDLTGPWLGALVAPTPGPAGKNPSVVVTDQLGGFTAGAFVGRRFMGRPGLYQALCYGTAGPCGPISANDTTSVTFTPDDCSYPCPGHLQPLVAPSFVGTEWAAASSSGLIRVDLTAQAPWSPTPDSLVGRTLMPKSNLSARSTILLNSGTSAVVTAQNFTFADAFSSLGAGQIVYLADGSNQYAYANISVSITPDVAPGWPANGFVGQTLVAYDGALVGQITANTATTVTVAANINYLPELTAGRAFAFAIGGGSGAPCYGSPQFSATATLTGMNFIAGNYDTLAGTGYTFFSAQVVSNTSTGAIVNICANGFPSLVSAIGSIVALTANGSFPMVLTDTSAAFTPGAYKGYSVRPTSTLGYSGYVYPPIVDNGAQTISLSLTSASTGLLTSLAAGTSYVLVDPTGLVPVRVSTGAALTPGALVGRFVHALATTAFYPYFMDQPLLVVANDASSITATLSANIYYGEFGTFVATSWQTLQISAGAALNVGDTAASFTANALVGQTVQLGGRNLVVTSNTAQGITVASSDPSLAAPPPATGAQYVLPALLAGASRVRAVSDGTALIGLGNVATYPFPLQNGTQAAVARMGSSGVTTLYTPLGTGQQVQVTPRATLRGTFTSLTNQSSFFSLITDTTATWTPNALAGASVSVRAPYGGWNMYTVMSNTATALQIYTGGFSLTADATRVYVIDPLRLDVTGGGLTPHALAGGKLWLQGTTYLVRDNDATSLLLHRSVAAPGISPVLPGSSATGWLLTGLRGNRVNGVALNGSGFVAATDDGISLFDGTNWSHQGARETATQLATGTVSDFTSTSVTCTPCNFTAGSLAGAQLLLSDGVYAILGNTAHVISLAASLPVDRPPLLGDSFSILDGRGLNTEATDVAVDGSTIWVTSSAGLLKDLSGTWSLLTSADGLPAASLTGAGVRVPGELWVSSAGAGVARLVTGSPPQQFTAAGTASSPGKGDGLPGDNIARISFDGSKTWFAGLGASSYSGTAWSAVSPLIVGSVNVVLVPSAGTAWFGNATGLISVLP